LLHIKRCRGDGGPLTSWPPEVPVGVAGPDRRQTDPLPDHVPALFRLPGGMFPRHLGQSLVFIAPAGIYGLTVAKKRKSPAY